MTPSKTRATVEDLLESLKEGASASHIRKSQSEATRMDMFGREKLGSRMARLYETAEQAVTSGNNAGLIAAAAETIETSDVEGKSVFEVPQLLSPRTRRASHGFASVLSQTQMLLQELTLPKNDGQ
jgi:hypothetical protein